MNIILMGCPGAGKGTQSAKLQVAYPLQHISTGDLLRAEMACGSALGKQVADTINRGNLVSDELMISLLASRVQATDKGIIFDGFPRTVAQAQALEKMLQQYNRSITQVIMIDLPEEEVVKRLSSRRLCKQCGKPAATATQPTCECGGELYVRADDTAQSVKHRLEVYRQQTLPVKTYYQNSGKYVEINGNQTPQQVFEDIKKVLEKVK
ncbi:MAG: adenylate kinase [Elusimicrobiaceae bacterium]|nr:adenylate kinase [Elusimicrobiaceae bacterium]